MSRLNVGIPAAAIRLPDLEARMIELDPGGPGPKVIIFYKVSCPTCTFAMPLYDRLYRAFEDSRFPLFGVIQDNLEGARAFATEQGLRMPQLVDDWPYAASRAYHIVNVPTMVVIDGEGTLVMCSPAFIREDLRRAASILAEAAGRPVPELFKDEEDVPELRPG
jgi:peroxiredoxin